MSEGNSVINLGDLTKPATTLIEKISDAVGVVYEPHKIKRLAKAEAEAEKIKTLAKLDLDEEIEQRALKRFIAEETIKQQNVENIIGKALPELNADAKPENIENDWLLRFIEESKLISDEEMQSLWAKLLAGEANEPGTFSKRTVDLISNLDKSDAELFTNLCSFCTTDGTLFIYTFNHEIYKQKGINHDSLAHLNTIGLISFSSDGYMLGDETLKEEEKTFNYFEKLIHFQSLSKNRNVWRMPDTRIINIGIAILTKIGRELAPICGAVEVDGFLDYCVEKWKGFGYTVSFPDKTESGK